MPRHRAPSAPSPARTALAGVAVTGIAFGVSVISPAAALAAPATTDTGLATDATPAHLGHHSDDSSDRASDDRVPHHHKNRHHRASTRPMTSGEQQYRNGCKQGYIKQGCNDFSVSHLLRRGINPYL